MIRPVLILALFLIGIVHLSAQIQVQKGFDLPPLGKDTICFRYEFVSGDTLIYTIDAADSISFEGDPVLLKVRREVVSVICDSAEVDRYHLRFTLRNNVEKQTTGRDSTKRDGSPWTGRDAFVTIDTLGNRLSVRVDDDERAALAPGGAFQPMILPTLGEACGVQNQSWLVEDTTLLVENGVPEPVFTHSTLWRVLDEVDTLGRQFRQIQYTQTALGRVQVVSPRVNVDMQGVIAAFGKLTLDSELLVPYHLFATSEDRLEITTPNGAIRKGKHQLSMHVRLREIRSPDPSRRFRLSP